MIQSFLEQAERAERLARGTTDIRTYEALMKYADECRLNADPAKVSVNSSVELSDRTMAFDLVQ
jgi:hypothetical protein